MNNEFNNYNMNDYNNQSTMNNNMNNSSSPNITNNMYGSNNENKKSSIVMIILIIVIVVGILVFISNKDSSKENKDNKEPNNEYLEINKKEMISTISSYMSAATSEVNYNAYGPLSNQDILYYIPVSNVSNDSCIYLEKGGLSTLGNWKKAYVVVSYHEPTYSYDYYFTFITEAGYEMPLIKSSKIKSDGSQITKSNRLNENNITSQLNERAKTTKILLTPKEAAGYQENVESCNIKYAKTGIENQTSPDNN